LVYRREESLEAADRRHGCRIGDLRGGRPEFQGF
jgi:hypothetical protein